MIEMIKTIFYGVITWLVCECILLLYRSIKKKFNDQKADNSKNRSNRPSRKSIVIEYYISLAMLIISFVCAIKLYSFNEFLHIMSVVFFSISMFLNWGAFECMNEALEDFTSNDSQNSD